MRMQKSTLGQTFPLTALASIQDENTLLRAALFIALIRNGQLAIENRQLRDRAQHAFKDKLTGLWNRDAYDHMIDEIVSSFQSGHDPRPQEDKTIFIPKRESDSLLLEDKPKPVSMFSLAMLDVNGLKEVNDSKGHDQGDLVIVRMADAIKATMRSSDRGFRCGDRGDEFIVFLNGAKSASRFVRRLDENVKAADPQISFAAGWVSASEFTNDVNMLPEALAAMPSKELAAVILQRADGRMYIRKKDMKAAMKAELLGPTKRD
jgi:diguanylate cyclase (GGDEF)-like protein